MGGFSLTVLLVLTACSTVAHEQLSASEMPDSSRSTPAIALGYGFPLPNGEHSVEIAGAADGSVFVWSEAMDGSSYIRRLNGNGLEAGSWKIADGDIIPRHGFFRGLAVGEGNAVWIGAGRVLFKLDLPSGEVTSWPLPSLPRSTVKDAATSDNQRVDEEIKALVIAGKRVVLGVSSASALAVFDPATKSFSEVALPDIGDISALAALADGTVGAGLTNYKTHRFDTFVMIPLDGVRATMSVETEAIQVAPWTEGFLVTGVGAVLVRRDGTTAPVNLAGEQANERVPPQLLSDGRLVVATTTQRLLVIGSESKRVEATVDLGLVTCGQPGGSHIGHDASKSVNSEPQPFPCPASVNHMASAATDLVVDAGGRGLQRASI